MHEKEENVQRRGRGGAARAGQMTRPRDLWGDPPRAPAATTPDRGHCAPSQDLTPQKKARAHRAHGARPEGATASCACPLPLGRAGPAPTAPWRAGSLRTAPPVGARWEARGTQARGSSHKDSRAQRALSGHMSAPARPLSPSVQQNRKGGVACRGLSPDRPHVGPRTCPR